jgi:NAD(P)-dependent dehydrogenase (short-subunit alcohol dehydrogenase family)
VAFITGAARAQGRSHAVRLAREGADIIALDICAPVSSTLTYTPATPEDLSETVRLVAAEGSKVLARQANIRDDAAMRRLVAGGAGVDIANPAAGLGPALGTHLRRRWDTVIRGEFDGHVAHPAAAVPAMIRDGFAVSLSSSGGSEGHGNSHYSASCMDSWG